MIRRLAIAALFCAGGPAADFHNVARQAGLTDSFPNGGAESKQYIIETTGSGAAFLDYDNDGLLDVFLVSGRAAPIASITISETGSSQT